MRGVGLESMPGIASANLRSRERDAEPHAGCSSAGTTERRRPPGRSPPWQPSRAASYSPIEGRARLRTHTSLPRPRQAGGRSGDAISAACTTRVVQEASAHPALRHGTTQALSKCSASAGGEPVHPRRSDRRVSTGQVSCSQPTRKRMPAKAARGCPAASPTAASLVSAGPGSSPPCPQRRARRPRRWRRRPARPATGWRTARRTPGPG